VSADADGNAEGLTSIVLSQIRSALTLLNGFRGVRVLSARGRPDLNLLAATYSRHVLLGDGFLEVIGATMLDEAPPPLGIL